MDDITAFRECYQRWANWIGFDKERVYKNTIWHQCTEMMNNEFVFQALSMAREKSSRQPDFHSFLSANEALYRYIREGYLGFQYLAIRRLIDPSSKDPKKGVTSIKRLIEDMKQHENLITRESFVCVDGLPYDFEQILAQEQADELARIMEIEERSGAIWVNKESVLNLYSDIPYLTNLVVSLKKIENLMTDYVIIIGKNVKKYWRTLFLNKLKIFQISILLMQQMRLVRIRWWRWINSFQWNVFMLRKKCF